MRSAFILFVFSVPLSAFAAPTPPSSTCSSSNVANCDDLRSTPINAAGALGFPRSKDGTVYYNPLGAYSAGGSLSDEGRARLASLTNPSSAQITSALATANEVRQAMIDFVRGDVRDEALTETDRSERDQIMTRLRTLQIRMVENEDSLCDGQVTLGTPQMGYWPQVHTLQICPAAAMADAPSLVRSIAHEMGHLAAECQITRSLFNVDPELANYGAIRDCDRTLIEGEEDGYVRDRALRLISEGYSSQVVESNTDPTIRALAQCGILKEVPNSAIAVPHVTRATQTCVESNSATAYSRVFDAYLESDVAHGSQRKQARAELERSFTPACFGRTQEQFADSFAGGFLGYFAARKKWHATEARASMLLFTGMQCLSITDYDTDQYPTYDVRNSALMNSPTMANLLGCSYQRHDARTCPLTLSTRRETNAAPAAPLTTQPARANR